MGSGGSGISAPSGDSSAMSGYLAGAGITGVGAATEEQPKMSEIKVKKRKKRTYKSVLDV